MASWMELSDADRTAHTAGVCTACRAMNFELMEKFRQQRKSAKRKNEEKVDAGLFNFAICARTIYDILDTFCMR